jgi:endonuclease/exonuclease/phosphatase family metal-dependent hydrolase
MRIVSWNLAHNSPEYRAHHEDAWGYLLDELRPDVALVQEAVPPEGLDRSLIFAKPWAKRPWGSAIIAASGRIRKGFTETSRGPVVLAELDDGMIVASIHARIVEGRTIPSLQKTMTALIPRLKDRRFAVGGDLNTARSAEEIWPQHGHQDFFESLTGMGLYDCYWELNDQTEKQSFWGRVSPHALQLDHLFVDIATGAEGKVRKCEIDDSNKVRLLSDHGPVVAEIDA